MDNRMKIAHHIGYLTSLFGDSLAMKAIEKENGTKYAEECKKHFYGLVRELNLDYNN